MKVKQLLEGKTSSVWGELNNQAKKKYGKGFASLNEKDAATLVDMKRANKIAEKEYGEFGLMTCSEGEIKGIIYNNPDLVKSEGKIFTTNQMIGKKSKLDGVEIVRFVRKGYDSWGRYVNVYVVRTEDGKEKEKTILRKDQIARWYE